MGPLMINMAFMPLYMREMRNVTPRTDGQTDGRTVESSAVFCLSRIRNNLKINVFPWQRFFLDFSFWIQGHRSVQTAHCALAQCIIQVSQNRLADPGGWTRSVLSLISTCYILSFVKLSQCRNLSMIWFRKIFSIISIMGGADGFKRIKSAPRPTIFGYNT